MKCTYFLLGLFSILVLCTNEIKSQENPILQLGKGIEKTIQSNERHRYTLPLETNQFAFLKLMQIGIDVKIITYDPDGKKLNEFDSPNGSRGPEYFSVSSEQPGEYQVEVLPLDENGPGGEYNIWLQILKPKAFTKADQVDELFMAWGSKDSPGACVSVVKDGKILFENGYGMANLEYAIPNTPTTIFHIASVSKQFTAFSILLLQQAGKVNLDDDIRDYIPEVPDFGKTITLRHLATHTSGMRDQWNLLAMAGWRLDDVITKEHVLKLVSKQQALNFDPGEEYTYCNTGFTLLAEVVARVSGQSFAEFTDEHIFEPLGMKNTLFYDDHEKIVPNRAYSYYSDGEGYKKAVLSYANVGATSLFTTVEDLSKWAMNFKDAKVGDTTLFSQLNQLAVLNNGETFGGALGQFVSTYKGLHEIQHGGADAGYRSYLTRFPIEDFAVVVFSNSAEFNAGRLAHQIVDIYLADKIQSPKEEPQKVEIPKEKETVVSLDMIKTYTGQFELQPGFVITITEEGGQLYGRATGQSTYLLEPISMTEFAVKGVEATIEFIPNGSESVQMIKLHQGGQIMEANRMKAFDKSMVDLSVYTGVFFSPELSTTYQFVLEDEKLMATHSRTSDFTLEPTKEDQFSGSAWYFRQVEFVRNPEGNISGCKVSNGRVRDLFFEKVN